MHSELRSSSRRRAGGSAAPLSFAPEWQWARQVDPGVDFVGMRSTGMGILTSTPVAAKVASRKSGDAASDSGFCESSPGSTSVASAAAADCPSLDGGEHSRRADACLSQSLADDAVILSPCAFETSHGTVEFPVGPIRDVDVTDSADVSLNSTASSECCRRDSAAAALLPRPFGSSACTISYGGSDTDSSAARDVVESAKVPRVIFCQKFERFLKNINPKEVIGWRVGLDHVDIVAELAGMGIPCLARIAHYLSPSDVRRCCMVSRTWQPVFHSYLPTALKGRLSNKENAAAGAIKRASRHSPEPQSGGRSSRALLSRPCLATVQPTVKSQQLAVQPAVTADTSPSPAAGFGSSVPSLHQRFAEEAKNLKCGEKLTRCPRCHHPARLNEAAERGVCTRLGCSFDYCTRCFGQFHGAGACPHAQQLKRTRSDTIGSQRSKRNLRRL